MYPFNITTATSYYVDSSQRIDQIYVLIDTVATVRNVNVKLVRKLKYTILDIEKKREKENINNNLMSIDFKENFYTVYWNNARIIIETTEYAQITLIIFAPNIRKTSAHKDNCNFRTLLLSKLFMLEKANKLDLFSIDRTLCGDTIWVYLYLKFLYGTNSFSQSNKVELFGLYHYIKSHLFVDGVVEYCEVKTKSSIHEKEFLRSIENKLSMKEVKQRIRLVENKKGFFAWLKASVGWR